MSARGRTAVTCVRDTDGAQIPVYPPDSRSSVPCHAHVIPGLVVVGHRVCGGHRAALGSGDRREDLGAFSRHGAGVGNPCSDCSADHQVDSHFCHSFNPSHSSHGSAMGFAHRKGLILAKPADDVQCSSHVYCLKIINIKFDYLLLLCNILILGISTSQCLPNR